jgi:AI-2 transport protein TqsA
LNSIKNVSRDTNVLNWLLAAASVVVIIAGVRAAHSLVVPFLVAAFLAVICTPALQWLQRKGVPTAIALLLVIGGMSAVVVGVGLVVTASIQDFSGKVPEYTAKLQQLLKDAEPWIDKAREWAGIGAADADANSDQLNNPLSPDNLVGYFVTFLSGITGLFGNVFLVLVTLMFMLLEASGFPRKLLALSGGRPLLSEQANRIRDSIYQYVTLKTIISLCTGMLVALLIKVLGVDYPVMWGLLAFFFNFVPSIGSIIAAVPAVLLALIQTDLQTTLFTVAGYVVINVAIGNFIEPRVMGRGLGLSTLVVFLSLVFWGWVLGPIGMLLSVPLTMIVKVALENFRQTRWIAVLLSANPEKVEAEG